MSYNEAALARSRETLSRRREANARELERRTSLVYRRAPRVAEIDAALRRQMARLCALAFSRKAGAASEVESLRRENLALQAEREEILAGLGLDAGYLDEIYSCALCRDTGYVDGAMCECLRREYNAELTRELSGLLRDDGETFEKFNFLYYSEIPDADGRSPRQVMEYVFDACRTYAEKFSHTSSSLIFRGGPGLGKTFLSACIARTVSENGFSVVYDTAGEIFSRFETQKFSRDEEETRGARDDTRRYIRCDLLILDDLGSEMTTPFVQSALYQLVNSRLTAGKRTVISSNLTMDDVRGRYSPQVTSRLEGEYRVLPFFGEDIRLQRRGRM